jgi:hypothetical protein
MKRRLPLGIQDFKTIREDGYVYVDKTARIYDLLTGSGKTFFLSRPRRFGKSLLCSTLGALFEGRRDLFGACAGQPALAIDSLDWDWKPYPVIRIDLNTGDYTRGVEVLFTRFNTALEFCAEKYAVSFDGNDSGDRFTRLIKNLAEQGAEKVVVIIDEYDKPLLSTIENKALHQQMRAALKGFYSVLKSSDEYLRFVFLTGVTKFAQVSVFSDLNHLTDISLDPAFCDICGITQEEMERDFGPEITKIVAGKGLDTGAYFAKVKRYYNGYRFSKKALTIYNPFGLLHHFNKGGDFLPYWFQTGTPTFLIKLIENQRIDILNLEKQTVQYDDFCKYDVENMEALPVLYQSGYLTISGYNEDRDAFSLDYPNEEVRASFAKSRVEKYLHVPRQDIGRFIARFFDAIYDGDVDGMMNTLKPFFASIPYDIIVDNEKYYQTVVHLLFTMFGLQCRSEVRIAAGRIDTLVETNTVVYCFEFKLNGTVEEALRQIDDKDYLLPWTGSGKTLYKAGVVFDTKKRTIGEWKTIEVLL